MLHVYSIKLRNLTFNFLLDTFCHDCCQGMVEVPFYSCIMEMEFWALTCVDIYCLIRLPVRLNEDSVL